MRRSKGHHSPQTKFLLVARYNLTAKKIWKSIEVILSVAVESELNLAVSSFPINRMIKRQTFLFFHSDLFFYSFWHTSIKLAEFFSDVYFYTLNKKIKLQNIVPQVQKRKILNEIRIWLILLFLSKYNHE